MVLDNGIGIVGNWSTSRKHQCYSNVKMSLNTEKDPENLKRVTVTQTPVKTISQRWFDKFARDNIIIRDHRG